MKTWAVTNQKGGSGKTTTAVNLAAALAEQGKRVLLVDLDPQGSASTWLGEATDGEGLFSVLAGNGSISSLVVETPAPGVDLVPSSPWLMGLDRALASEPGAETILREKLAGLRGGWDLCFLDCPPALGLLSLSALVAARRVLVPVEASTMALAGLASLVQTVDRVKARLNPRLALGALLVCRAAMRTRLTRELEESLRERFPGLVLPTMIRETTRLREAWSHGQPVTMYDTRGAGAADYRAAAEEFLALDNRKGRA